MSAPIKLLRKVFALVIGIPLLIVGIILIPLPGPGLLVSFIALYILSLEFEIVSGPFNRVKQELQLIYKKAKARADKINKPS